MSLRGEKSSRVKNHQAGPDPEGGTGARAPPVHPLVAFFFLPCKTIFLTLFKTSKIKPSCAA